MPLGARCCSAVPWQPNGAANTCFYTHNAACVFGARSAAAPPRSTSRRARSYQRRDARRRRTGTSRQASRRQKPSVGGGIRQRRAGSSSAFDVAANGKVTMSEFIDFCDSSSHLTNASHGVSEQTLCPRDARSPSESRCRARQVRRGRRSRRRRGGARAGRPLIAARDEAMRRYGIPVAPLERICLQSQRQPLCHTCRRRNYAARAAGSPPSPSQDEWTEYIDPVSSHRCWREGRTHESTWHTPSDVRKAKNALCPWRVEAAHRSRRRLAFIMLSSRLRLALGSAAILAACFGCLGVSCRGSGDPVPTPASDASSSLVRRCELLPWPVGTPMAPFVFFARKFDASQPRYSSDAHAGNRVGCNPHTA